MGQFDFTTGTHLKVPDYGLSFEGVVTTYTDTTHFKVSTLAGKGTGFFKPVAGTPYEIYVVQADGAAPEGEQTPVEAYTSSDGTFEHVAFTAPLAVGDIVLIIHPLIASIGTKATAQASGAVTTSDFMMAYIKQLVTLLIAQDVVVDNLHDTDIPAIKGDTETIIADTEDIQSTLGTPANFMANVSALALEATLTAIKGGGWSDETLVAIKAAIDTITGISLSSDWKGNFNWDTSEYSTAETDISALFSTNLALDTRRRYTVTLKLTAVEADANFVSLHLTVKAKTDGTNYDAIDRKTITKAQIVASAEPGIVIDIPATSENVQITMQMTTALAGDATIYYAVVKEHLE